MAGLSLRHRLEAAALSALGLLLRPLPLRWVSLPGAALGWLLFSVFRLERKTTLRNIELAFGAALPAAARRRLARDCYMFFGGLACEVLSQARLRPATIARHIELEGLAALDEALAAGRGVVMVSGHYGNWELLGAGLAARGYPVSYYVGQQENPVADAALNAVRRASGLGTVPKGPSIRNLLRLLRAGQVLGLLADQHYIHKTHYIRFFGQPVSAAPGAASLALRTGARVVFCWAEPIGRYRYRAHFRAVRCSPSGEEARDVLALSQAISDALEAQVRRAPAFYFWMHRRFRPQPAHLPLTALNLRFLAETAAAHPLAPGVRPVFEPRAATNTEPGAGGRPQSQPPTGAAALGPARPRPALFLDLDGTLIEDVGYLSAFGQMRLLPGAAEAIARANAAGHPVVVLTNQSGVARGYITEAFARESADHLRALLAAHGARIDGYHYAPEHPQGRPPYDIESDRRKPGAGMVLAACRELGLQPAGAYMIGDQRSDIETGAHLGLIPLLVRTGSGRETERALPADFAARGGRVFESLAEAIDWILARDAAER